MRGGPTFSCSSRCKANEGPCAIRVRFWDYPELGDDEEEVMDEEGHGHHEPQANELRSTFWFNTRESA